MNLGMLSGGALAQIYVPNKAWGVAGFGESNALTVVSTPEWFWNWMAAPLLR